MGHLMTVDSDPDDQYPPPHLRPITIGVDVGQLQDPTAVAVAELDHTRSDDRPDFLIRRFFRLPIGTSYPAVADRLIALVEGVRERDVPLMRAHLMAHDGHRGPDNEPRAERRNIELRIDATGVGRPLLDTISDPLRAMGVAVRAVTFRAGETMTQRGNEWSMGKGFLVARLQVVLQSEDRVQISDALPERVAVVAETNTYQIHINDAGRAKFGAMRQGQHDDMVTALALATLTDIPRPRPPASAEDIDRYIMGDYYDPS